jgi:hypothetical protein
MLSVHNDNNGCLGHTWELPSSLSSSFSLPSQQFSRYPQQYRSLSHNKHFSFTVLPKTFWQCWVLLFSAFHWTAGRPLSSLKPSIHLSGTVPLWTVWVVCCCHVLTNCSCRTAHFCSFSLMVQWRWCLLVIAASIECAALMNLSNITLSGLLLRTHRSAVTDMS